MNKYFVLLGFALASLNPAQAETILFESGTLGETGLLIGDLGSAVPGTNIKATVFAGVRFELNHPVVTTQVGGHFLADSSGTFFGAIVALSDEFDFPDSDDLTSSDVVGHVKMTFPVPSDEVLGNLSVQLAPGWYSLVFGSGQFNAAGTGAAVRNGMDIGDPKYIAFGPNLGWFNLDGLQLPFDNHHFVVLGNVIPEPTSIATAALSMLCLLIARNPFSRFLSRLNRLYLR